MNINATKTNGFYGAHEIIAKYIQSVYIQDVQLFAQALSDRILPSFSNLEAEAEKIGQNEYLSSISEYQAETAFERSAEWFISMTKVRQSVINLHAVGLSHLFEQQLYDLTYAGQFDYPNQRNTGNKRDKRTSEEKQKQRYADFNYDKKLHSEIGKISVETLTGWKTIEKLRLVCNAVKHSEGRSIAELRTLNPALFEPPPDVDEHIQELRAYIQNLFSKDKNHLPEPIKIPLAGEDIYVKEEDIKKYADAIKEFWSDFIRWLLETP